MEIEELARKMREEALAQQPESVRRVEELRQLQRRIELEEATRAERQHQEEIKLYFNAGRYSGGARDKTAIESWKKLNVIQ